ncbi:hypothetical protein E1292_46720 [Nonomuraea deserti]|uniref:Uncharacterized protein n=1 Tax=Nonomuraea deserti TaxID=1848322 RepID=A0A4R4UGM5_9ACTN|nr:hypothetical protein [Nonomuraea deserti]TDC87393.1 hypothetical protein E1292_46720 [Nonomuraea deserti]
MPNYEELKGRIYSEIQALQARTQAAKELQGHFGEGGWDESEIGVLSGYHDSAAKWNANLSRLLNVVEEREKRRPSAPPSFDPERFATELDKVARRLEVAQEELAEQTAIAQEELARRLATAQEALKEESIQLLSHLHDSVKVAGRPAHSDPEPERSPVRPDEARNDEPPENPDPWSKS